MALTLRPKSSRANSLGIIRGLRALVKGWPAAIMLATWIPEPQSWRSRMFQHVHAALRRIQRDLAQVLDPTQIIGVCKQAGYRFRQRVLDPVTTIHLFVLQILQGNFAVARLKDFTDKAFSVAAYCKAR